MAHVMTADIQCAFIRVVEFITYTIFQKLHFSKSQFYETAQEIYDDAIFLQIMSPKMCHKILKIGSLIK